MRGAWAIVASNVFDSLASNPFFSFDLMVSIDRQNQNKE
jgi:hypothetical protein